MFCWLHETQEIPHSSWGSNVRDGLIRCQLAFILWPLLEVELHFTFDSLLGSNVPPIWWNKRNCFPQAGCAGVSCQCSHYVLGSFISAFCPQLSPTPLGWQELQPWHKSHPSEEDEGKEQLTWLPHALDGVLWGFYKGFIVGFCFFFPPKLSAVQRIMKERQVNPDLALPRSAMRNCRNLEKFG